MLYELSISWPRVVTLTPRIVVVCVVIGFFGGLALHAFRANRDLRLERLNLWLGWWCASAIGLLVGRTLQRIADTDGLAIVGNRLLHAFGFLLCLCSAIAVRAMCGRRPHRTALRWVPLAATIAIAIACVLTPWFVCHAGRVCDDWLGGAYITTDKGPLVAFLPTAVIGTFAYAAVLIYRARSELEFPPRLIALLFGAVAVTSMLDLLGSLGIGPHPQLIEVALATAAILMSTLAIDRNNATRAGLRSALSAHSAALEAAVAETQQTVSRFRQLSRATTEGIVVHDAGKIIDANQAALRMFGQGSLEGCDLADMIDGPSFDALDKDEPVEVVAHGADGDFAAELVFGAVRADDGEPVEVVAVRDISERLRMQSRLMQTDRLASLGALAAGTAHEINNPLTYILISLDMLDRELKRLPITPAQRDDLQELVADVTTGAGRVASIVGDLKKLSRGDDDSAEVGVSVVDSLEAAITLTTSETRHRATIDRDFNAVPLVCGQEHRLVQIFVNLLINAAHAMPAGNVRDNRIRIRVRQSLVDSVIVEIEDTGGGMSEELRAKVFEPFVTTKPIGEGTGLGLAICRDIVTDLGGHIEIASEIGVGTSIRVRLPEWRATLPDSDKPRQNSGFRRRGRVLIIDDEPLIGRLFSRILGHHQTVVTLSGREALTLLEERPFDVILCDLMMPDVTGLELYEELSRRAPDVADRMLFMTGGVFTVEERRFVDQLGSRCIQKPVTPAKLRAEVERLLDHETMPRDEGRHA